jgi:hypothetical protein
MKGLHSPGVRVLGPVKAPSRPMAPACGAARRDFTGTATSSGPRPCARPTPFRAFPAGFWPAARRARYGGTPCSRRGCSREVLQFPRERGSSCAVAATAATSASQVPSGAPTTTHSLAPGWASRAFSTSCGWARVRRSTTGSRRHCTSEPSSRSPTSSPPATTARSRSPSLSPPGTCRPTSFPCPPRRSSPQKTPRSNPAAGVLQGSDRHHVPRHRRGLLRRARRSRRDRSRRPDPVLRSGRWTRPRPAFLVDVGVLQGGGSRGSTVGARSAGTHRLNDRAGWPVPTGPYRVN